MVLKADDPPESAGLPESSLLAEKSLSESAGPPLAEETGPGHAAAGNQQDDAKDQT
jgi:hypothetical protein